MDFSEQYTHFSRSKKEDRLTKEGEIVLSKKIKKARARLYFDIFGYAPFVIRIVDFIETKLGMEEHQRGIKKGFEISFEPLLISTRKFRDVQRHVVRDAWANQRSLFAIEMAGFDLDNSIAKELITFIEASQSSPRGSKVFARYKQQIKNSLDRLTFLKARFVKANIGLVLSIARKYKYKGLPFEDMVQQGMLGLMKGVERFDETKGFKFSTYGTWWIRHSIVRYAESKGEIIRVPSQTAKRLDLLNRTRTKLELAGIDPTNELIAKEMGISLAKVEKIINIKPRVLSLYTKWENPNANDEVGFSSLESMVPNKDPGPEELLSDKIDKQRILDGIEELSPRLQTIIKKRFGFEEQELTLKEVGKELGVCRERIRQLQNEALEELRIHIEEK